MSERAEEATVSSSSLVDETALLAWMTTHIDGFTPTDPLPPPFDHDPAARHGLGLELVDALAELALVDWEAVGLQGFGKPHGFLARQVDRWLWQLDTYRTREIPEINVVT